MGNRIRAAVMAIAAAIALAGCEAMKDVMTVSAALDKRFHEPMNINFNNGSHLVITLVNAPESELDEAGREDYARSVAAFAKSSWPHPSQLDDITVAYSSVSKKGIVTYTNTDASFRWRLDELPAPPAADTTRSRSDSAAPATANRS